MEPFERPPFSSELEDTSFKRRIKSLKENPNVIIRQQESFSITRLDGTKDKENLNFKLERYRRSKELFEEWQKYGIQVAKIDTVFSQPEAKAPAEVYVVTERIEGQNMSDTAYESGSIEQLDQSIGQTLAGLLQYYKDKIQNGGYFLGDVRWSQFVFGSKADEPDTNRQLYYIDVEPFYNKYTAGAPIEVKTLQAVESIIGLTHQAILKRKIFNSDLPLPREWLKTWDEIKVLIRDLTPNVAPDAQFMIEQLERNVSRGEATIQAQEVQKPDDSTPVQK